MSSINRTSWDDLPLSSTFKSYNLRWSRSCVFSFIYQPLPGYGRSCLSATSCLFLHLLFITVSILLSFLTNSLNMLLAIYPAFCLSFQYLFWVLNSLSPSFLIKCHSNFGYLFLVVGLSLLGVSVPLKLSRFLHVLFMV